MAGNPTERRPDGSFRQRWLTGGGVLLILLVGLWFRANHLADRPIWNDEFCGLPFSLGGAENLFAGLEICRKAGQMMHFYYSLQYFWAHYVNASVVGLRWLSILCGLAGIVLTYRFGRDLYGRGAGLLAALFMALSPFQIAFGYELRPYIFLSTLGLASAYAFHKWLRTGSRGWCAVNMAVNMALMWTHLFGAWLLITEGIYLLVFRGRRFTRIAVWAGIQVLLLVPVAILMLPIDNPRRCTQDAGWVWLPVSLFLMDVFDALKVAARYDPTVDFVTLPPFIAFCAKSLGVAAATVAGCCFFCTVSFAGRLLRLRAGATSNESLRRTREEGAFLLAWFALPTVLLLLFSMVIPAFQMRYVIYSQPALYLIVAGVLVHMRRPAWRAFASLLIVLAMGISAVTANSLPLRSDYLRVADFIRTHRTPNENILVFPSFLSASFKFNYYCSDRRKPVMFHPAVTNDPFGSPYREELPIRILGFDFAHALDVVDAEVEQQGGVWFIHDIWEPQSRTAATQLLGRYASLRRIECTKTQFLSFSDIIVYCCRPGSGYKPFTDPEALAEFRAGVGRCPDDVVLIWLLADAQSRAGRTDDAVQAYREIYALIPWDAPSWDSFREQLMRSGWGYFNYGDPTTTFVTEVTLRLCQLLLFQGRNSEALELCRRARPMASDNIGFLTVLADAFGACGDPDAAKAVCVEAITLNPQYFPPYEILDNLWATSDHPEGRVAQWREIARAHPDAPHALLFLARALEAQDDLNGAAAAYADAATLQPDDASIQAGLGQVLLQLGRFDEAIAPLRAALERNASLDHLHTSLALALYNTGAREAALAELERCRELGVAIPPELASLLPDPTAPGAPQDVP